MHVHHGVIPSDAITNPHDCAARAKGFANCPRDACIARAYLRYDVTNAYGVAVRAAAVCNRPGCSGEAPTRNHGDATHADNVSDRSHHSNDAHAHSYAVADSRDHTHSLIKSYGHVCVATDAHGRTKFHTTSATDPYGRAGCGCAPVAIHQLAKHSSRRIAPAGRRVHRQPVASRCRARRQRRTDGVAR